MSQGSQVIADNPGAVVRAALNTELAALYSNSSGSTAPSVTVAYQLWQDTTTGLLKQRDAANANWVAVGAVDQTNKIWQQPMAGGNASIASATTTDLGSSNAATVTVTGTTTITGFGSAMLTGQIKEVTFSGALTLTHNGSSLILPSAANIVTAAGDCALVMCISAGNYKVINYTRADGTPVGGSSYKAVGFTRNTTTATGTAAVTGVGFKPKAVMFLTGFTAGGNTASQSIGMDDASFPRCWFNLTTAVNFATSADSILGGIDGSNYQHGFVSSFDADGFTVSWTKVGSPTGTLTAFALCFR